MTVIFSPLIPLWGLVLVGAIGATAALFGIIRDWRGGTFRLIAFTGLLGLLANPTTQWTEKTPLNDIAILAVDDSASQRLAERSSATARAESALMARLEQFDDLEIRRVEIGGEDETRAATALQAALADIPAARRAGILMITDGRISDADRLDPAHLDAPFHLLLTGTPDERDRKITLLSAPRYGIVGQPTRISFRVDDLSGDGAVIADAPPVEVTLKIDGETVLSQAVPTGVEAGFDAPLDRPGEMIIELETASLAGELTTRNNIAVLPLTAIRDRLRVLLISGEPHPGERVWRNLLKSDPAVDLVHFTILRPIEKNDGTPVSELALIQFPQDELFIEKLPEFDLVIFDRYTYRAVLSAFHFDNIARYVEQGGAMLIAAGPEFNGPRSLASWRNLSFILPALPAGAAQDGAFRPQISDLGRRHPVTANLPEEAFWGRWLRQMPVTTRSGDILMNGADGAPLLLLDRVQEGRIGLFLSDHFWLWARGFDGGGPHTELLRRIAHWLMKEPELEEEALALLTRGGDLIIQRRTLETAPAPVSLTAPDGELSSHELSEINPGLFEARIVAPARGLYRARSGDLFAIGEVGLAAQPEFQDVASSAELLGPFADASGGGVFRLHERAAPALRRLSARSNDRAGADWAGLLRRDAARIDAVEERPLVSPYLWLALIGAALLMAWLIESGRLTGLAQRLRPSGD